MFKILYVEDNPQNMRLVRKILMAAGYEVIEATNGLSGIATAEREKPDLILMDVNLPDINGLEATTRLKASEAPIASIPVIALTANAMHGDRENCMAAGCDGYLAKPVMKNELLNTVALFLKHPPISTIPVTPTPASTTPAAPAPTSNSNNSSSTPTTTTTTTS